MTRVLWLSVVAALLLGACTDQALPEPVEVDTCDGLVSVGVVFVERMADELAGLPVAVVTGQAPAPEPVEELFALGRELDVRVARLGCDPAALNAAVVERTANLVGGDPAVDVFLEVVRGGVVGTLPDPPPTTVAPDAGGDDDE